MSWNQPLYDDDSDFDQREWLDPSELPRPKCRFCGGQGWTWEGGPCGCDEREKTE